MLKSFFLKTRSFGRVGALALALTTISCTSNPQPTNPSPNANSAASPSSTDADKPKVVATASVLCDITQEIARDTVDLTCLIPAGTDPHAYETRPSDRKAIEKANLILYNGYGFEADLIKLIKAAKTPAPKVAVGEVAVTKPLQIEEREHEGEDNAEAGDEHVHGESDPHVWHDAKNGIRMVETVRDSLEKLSPNHAATYSSNAEKAIGELSQIDSWMRSQIETIPASRRKLVTTHDAMGYYAAAYGIPIEGALQGISTDERPTAARLKELVEEIKGANVPMIFAETTANPKLIESVAREANVKVSDRELYADGLGENSSEANTYKKMLIANTQAIVEGLGGNYTPFQAK